MHAKKITEKLQQIGQNSGYKYPYTRIHIYADGSGTVVIRPHSLTVELAEFHNLNEIPQALEKALSLSPEVIAQKVEFVDQHGE